MNLFTIDVRISADPALLKVLQEVVMIFSDRKEAAELAEEVGRDAAALASAIPKT